jgi:hypothetical protein
MAGNKQQTVQKTHQKQGQRAHPDQKDTRPVDERNPQNGNGAPGSQPGQGNTDAPRNRPENQGENKR